MRGCGSLGDVDAAGSALVRREERACEESADLVQPRYAMSLMRGPMTRLEIRCMCALLRTDGVAPGTGTNTAFATSCQEREAVPTNPLSFCRLGLIGNHAAAGA